jgi:hypothetical protein
MRSAYKKTACSKEHAHLRRDEPEAAARRGPCPPKSAGRWRSAPHRESRQCKGRDVSRSFEELQLSLKHRLHDAAVPRLPWDRYLPSGGRASATGHKPRRRQPDSRKIARRRGARSPSSPLASDVTASAPLQARRAAGAAAAHRRASCQTPGARRLKPVRPPSGKRPRSRTSFLSHVSSCVGPAASGIADRADRLTSETCPAEATRQNVADVDRGQP